LSVEGGQSDVGGHCRRYLACFRGSYSPRSRRIRHLQSRVAPRGPSRGRDQARRFGHYQLWHCWRTGARVAGGPVGCRGRNQDSTSTAAKTTSSKRPRSGRIAKRAPSQIAPLPTTNGLAGAEGRDQSPSQRTTEKDEKHTPQLTPAERQALFDDFLKWYMDKSVFGPGR